MTLPIPNLLVALHVTTELGAPVFLRLNVNDQRSSHAHEDSQRLVDIAKNVASSFRFSPRTFGFIEWIEILFLDDRATLTTYTRLADRDRHADTFSGEPISVRFDRYLLYFEPIDRERFWTLLRKALLECLLHEMDECFYEGETRPFDPHKDDEPVFEPAFGSRLR